MRVVVIGAAGFLGRKLVKALLASPELTVKGERRALQEVVAFDQVAPALEASLLADARLQVVTGDIGDVALMRTVITAETAVVFHLAAVVSGEAEKNFDLGMRVNLQATQQLLACCRERAAAPMFVFSSSVAVFGGDLPALVPDSFAPTPLSSYGCQKAMAELLINDYSRKGFIDARILRLPTIVVRAGKANAATSSFASSIIREPLQGQPALCPVAPETRLWLLSPAQAIVSFLLAIKLSAGVLGANRILNLPGLSVSVQEMVASLESIAGKEVTARINWQPDPFIQEIVGSWPSAFSAERARALGFTADARMDDVIQSFIREDLER